MPSRQELCFNKAYCQYTQWTNKISLWSTEIHWNLGDVRRKDKNLQNLQTDLDVDSCITIYLISVTQNGIKDKLGNTDVSNFPKHQHTIVSLFLRLSHDSNRKRYITKSGKVMKWIFFLFEKCLHCTDRNLLIKIRNRRSKENKRIGKTFKIFKQEVSFFVSCIQLSMFCIS